MYEGSNFSASSSTLVIVCLSVIALLVGVKWYSAVVLFCISPVANDVEHHFHMLIVICMSSPVIFCIFTPPFTYFQTWAGGGVDGKLPMKCVIVYLGGRKQICS